MVDEPYSDVKITMEEEPCVDDAAAMAPEANEHNYAENADHGGSRATSALDDGRRLHFHGRTYAGRRTTTAKGATPYYADWRRLSDLSS